MRPLGLGDLDARDVPRAVPSRRVIANVLASPRGDHDRVEDVAGLDAARVVDRQRRRAARRRPRTSARPGSGGRRAGRASGRRSGQAGRRAPDRSLGAGRSMPTGSSGSAGRSEAGRRRVGARRPADAARDPQAAMPAASRSGQQAATRAREARGAASAAEGASCARRRARPSSVPPARATLGHARMDMRRSAGICPCRRRPRAQSRGSDRRSPRPSHPHRPGPWRPSTMNRPTGHRRRRSLSA